MNNEQTYGISFTKNAMVPLIGLLSDIAFADCHTTFVSKNYLDILWGRVKKIFSILTRNFSHVYWYRPIIIPPRASRL